MQTSSTPAIPDGFDYVGDVYRPPGEAHNILIQATVGCSYGKCTFCAGHGEKTFAVKDQEILEQDLLFAERYCTRQDRVFIMDGNAIALPMRRWIWLLENIRTRLPWVRGVGAFATGMDLARKSDKDLRRLSELGLDRVYLGVESGHAEALLQVRKGIAPGELVKQGRRVKAAGMRLFVTVLLGIVNQDLSLAHARATGEVLSAMDADAVTVMTLIPLQGTPIYRELETGRLTPPDTPGILKELRELLEHTDLKGGVFDYGHSAGYLSFTSVLPEEKALGLAHIDAALAGRVGIRPDSSRRI